MKKKSEKNRKKSKTNSEDFWAIETYILLKGPWKNHEVLTEKKNL